MPDDTTIPADIVRQITEDDNTGDAGTKKFTKAFLDSLAEHGVGWQEEGVNDSMFVVNGEGVEYYFIEGGRMELDGDGADTVRDAINSFVVGDPTNVEGGRKTKRKTRATKKSRKTRATKKSRKSRKVTRRR